MASTRLGVAAVALAVFCVAFAGGAYSLESRTAFAIAIWWAILVAIGFALAPLAAIPRPALVAGGLLAALALLTAASMAWAPSAERAFLEFDRVSLYLGVFALVVLASPPGSATRWSDGIAVGVAAVGVVALSSRLFVGIVPAGDLPTAIPNAAARLSYPVGYWNGLAILVALAFPLLLRLAIAAPRPAQRAAAVAVLPALAGTIFLTSSRGGVVAAALGTLVFVGLTARRGAALGAVAAAAAGSLAVVAVLLARTELVNDPFESAAAPSQGRSAALLILVICAATAVAYALASRHVARSIRIPSLAVPVLVALVVVVALVGVAASDPVDRFRAFKEPPGAHRQSDFVQAHLLAGSGSGRWQFWSAAVDEFRRHPLLGEGAGSFEGWWTQHRTLPLFARDAHSLYLASLGELGVLGFLLVASTFGVGIAVALPRIRAGDGDDRVAAAAPAATFVAYAFAVGIDWMWELTVVSVVGIASLALLTGPATARAPGEPARGDGRPGARRRFALVAGSLAVGWLLVCAQAIPLLAEERLSESRAAARAGDSAAALGAAAAARNLSPWAASPYLQLALVEEETGDLAAASHWIDEAIARGRKDWRLWLVAARIQTKAGDIPAARASLARARDLNPRSPLFAQGRP